MANAMFAGERKVTVNVAIEGSTRLPLSYFGYLTSTVNVSPDETQFLLTGQLYPHHLLPHLPPQELPAASTGASSQHPPQHPQLQLHHRLQKALLGSGCSFRFTPTVELNQLFLMQLMLYKRSGLYMKTRRRLCSPPQKVRKQDKGRLDQNSL